MNFEGDIVSGYVKISIESASFKVKSEKWSALILRRQGEKKGGGSF